MLIALRWLLHNTLGHTALGVLHFAGDIALIAEQPLVAVWLWRAGDAVHALTLPPG